MTTVTPNPNGPLSPSQQQQVAAAKKDTKKIRKAAAVANFNGWSIGLFAALSAPFALFSLPGFLISAGMALVAYNEFRGRRHLLQFDEAAPTFLGWNQVGFLALIVFYCLWMLLVGLTGEGPFTTELKAKPELSAVFDSPGQFDQYYRWMLMAIYGTAIVLATLFQGGNAIYYFTRRKHVTAYVQKTPAWVLDLQRLT